MNWNGADDTIACLSSLSEARGEFCVVVADNGSTDDSVERIEKYLSLSSLKSALLPLGKNWGFAAGNNRAIEFAAEKFSPDSFMLLNNDTEVEPDFLEKLVSYSAKHQEYVALSPRIDYWTEKGKVWFCGGKLSFGSRKNLYKNQILDKHSVKPFDISFISGCGLFFRSSLLNNDHKLLTELFFFGEEDYEFSLRMRKLHKRMACVPESVVYHKVGSSAKRAANEKKIMGRDYMYYLGRLIAARGYYCQLSFELILFLTCLRANKVFASYGFDDKELSLLLKTLRSDARNKEGISYEDFSAMVVDRSYFNFLNIG